MLIIFTIIIFFLSYEAIMWGWTLNRHAVWLDTHVKDRRITVSHKILKMASIMASSLSILLWIWWLVVLSTTLIYGSHMLICGLLISFVQLSHIHFSVILARYACLPRSMWPMFSKYISIFLCKYTNLPEPILTSGDLYICWGEDYEK